MFCTYGVFVMLWGGRGYYSLCMEFLYSLCSAIRCFSAIKSSYIIYFFLIYIFYIFIIHHLIFIYSEHMSPSTDHGYWIGLNYNRSTDDYSWGNSSKRVRI